MTRGKYSKSAAARRDAAHLGSELEAHQRAVARLTAEVSDLREQLDRERRAHAQDVRALRAQVDEGASPQVAALEHELTRVRSERDESRAQAQRIRSKHVDFFGKFADNVARRLGVSRWDAVQVMTGSAITAAGAERKFVDTYGADALRALRIAREPGGFK